ncbi:MAG: 2-amino-4-hydroxy-6-hydroxymethyldihydropteridine diphosphokinase [Succinivibrionaceae bacterium]
MTNNNLSVKHHAVIGIGSNLDSPVEQVKQALIDLKGHHNIKILNTSSLYSSKPVGPQDQPYFINAVVSIETFLDSHELLDYLQSIEQKHRRVRIQHWGPRTLDLDILFYDNENINTPRLTVPHPEILNRVFVVIPLLEIYPEYTLPNGTLLKNYIKNLPKDDLQLLEKII